MLTRQDTIVMDTTTLNLPIIDFTLKDSNCLGMLGWPQLGLVRERTFCSIVTVMLN